MFNSLSQHQQQFFNKTRQRIYFRDQDRKLTWANQSFLADIGVETSAQPFGTTLNEIVLEDAVADILAEVEDATYESRDSQTRTQLRCSIGSSSVAVSVECNPVHSEDGTFEGIVGHYSIEDVCNYLGYEKILIDSLMKNTQDFIYFKDRTSKFTRVSDSMIQRLGAKDMEGLIGKSDFDFWDFDCAQGFFEDEQKIIATREPMYGRCEEEVRSDGISTWAISSKMPLFDEEGNVIGTFGISKDITDLKQTELKLEETHKQLIEASRQAGMAEIATNVIHNVGNVLNSINVSIAMGRDLIRNQNVVNLRKAAQLLEENVDTSGFLLNDPKGKVLPGFIKLSAETLENTQQKLLDEFDNLRKHLDHIKTVISMQQEYAGAKHILEHLNIASLVEDAIQIGEGTLQRSGVKVIKQYKQDIEADVEKHKVLQILINLIRNAKHACEDTNDRRQKEITITIDTPAEDFFTIEISDNGVGINPKHLTSIFNHGFTTKDKGKGFGLHSSANTAKEMGGSLIATSAGLGSGASFVLTLPVKPKERKHYEPTQSISDSVADEQLPAEVTAAIQSATTSDDAPATPLAQMQ